MHLREGGIDLGEGLPKRGVEGVHRAIPLGHFVPLCTGHGKLHRRLGPHDVTDATLDRHVVGQLLESRPERPGDPIHE